MPTVITKTIKPDGTGDYLTLQAWITAQGADLPVLDQIRRAVCYSGGNLCSGGELLFLPGWGVKSDATRYYDIVAAPGHEHPGYWDTGKAYFQAAAGYAIRSYDNVVHLTGMQFKSNTNICLYAPPGAASYIADMCLLNGVQGLGTDTGAQVHRLTHSQIVVGTGGLALYCRGNGVTMDVYDCTIIAPSGQGMAAYLGCVFTSENCYWKAALCYQSSGGGAVVNKGANDATSTAEATNPALRNIPFSTATFVSVTGTLDLHLAAGSALIDTGADLSAIVGSYDFEGTVRPQGAAWDIGADEAPPAWKSCGGAATGPVPTAAGAASRGTYCVGAATGAAPVVVCAADNPTCAGVLFGPSPTAHGHAHGSGERFSGRLFTHDGLDMVWSRGSPETRFSRAIPDRIFTVQ